MKDEVQSPASRCLLLELPPELLVAICARADFPSLSALIRSHSQLKAIWDAHAERIARAICIRRRLAEPQSCGAAQPLENVVGTELPHPETELDGEELASVVKSQRWMHDSAGISSWVDYARVRHPIHRNWLAGHAQVRYLRLDFAPPSLPPFQQMPVQQEHIWRFKLDPEPGYVVATGRIFGVHAFRASDGVRVWDNTTPFLPYAHVELSAGHFATATEDMRHALWRRDDLDPDFDPDSVGPDRPLEYTLARHLDPNAPCSATKMRWPYFVAVSSNSDHVFCYDLSRSPLELVTHRMTAFWEPEAAGGLGEENVHYVEIDSRAIYLAGRRSVSMWRYDEPEEPHIVWPPDPPAPNENLAADADVDMASSSPSTGSPPQHTTHYRSSDLEGFSAVHHDGCGQHLVGIAGESGAQMRLYWTCDYLTTLWSGDRALLERKTVVLTTPTLPCSVTIDQLAVENGRAVFIVHDEDVGNSLWLINLHDFADHADFVAAPPKPICLAWPLPCGTAISRVEMTSDEIYVPAVSEMLRPNILTTLGNMASRFGDRPLYDWQWHALDGTVLVDYNVASGDDETVDATAAKEQAANARIRATADYSYALDFELEGEWQHSGTDAFAVYSFRDM